MDSHTCEASALRDVFFIGSDGDNRFLERSSYSRLPAQGDGLIWQGGSRCRSRLFSPASLPQASRRTRAIIRQQTDTPHVPVVDSERHYLHESRGLFTECQQLGERVSSGRKRNAKGDTVQQRIPRLPLPR
ncbi:hypothetical protein AVEN_257487-1 [Araneus ventricosus]|uniref:Uncharacterized protein n=1 Tax=Araneus ventricosus TaxID=182803 RepID=A0A4Y2LYB3_ARAVE|nr:hypothetical protein AVEN_257487-1 [Araneus ventricosus]